MKTLAFCITLFFLSFAHPYYLSVTDLSYNTKEKSLQGSLKIFDNDFEKAISKFENKKVDIMNPKDSVLLQKQIDNYVHQHLEISVNDKKIPYKILGKELEDGNILIFIEANNCALPKNIRIINTLLYQSFKEQINILQVEVGTKKLSHKLTNPENEWVFNF